MVVVSLPPVAITSPPVSEETPVIPVSEDDNIFFLVRSAAVDDAGKEKLRQLADRLKLDRKETVLLVGYTDDRGSRSYNLALTEERLTTVGKLLRTYGVPARQIRRNRIGRVAPPGSCSTDACRQQMRRVELVHSP
jgi:outer membrane protein OmpA-like peptidoglycan-associated protein